MLFVLISAQFRPTQLFLYDFNYCDLSLLAQCYKHLHPYFVNFLCIFPIKYPDVLFSVNFSSCNIEYIA